MEVNINLKKKITNTHFTLEGRMIIESGLNEGKNISQIANDLQWDKTNIDGVGIDI